jgi:peptide/nickel transport system ATP-binding protein
VACHYAEEIEAGRIKPHEVEAELVRPLGEAESTAPGLGDFVIAP